jgi:predicted MFS family arabinose efflux permease
LRLQSVLRQGRALSSAASDPSYPSPPSGTERALRRVAAALTHRNFRVLWIGACVSTIGTWMQKVAQSWLVLTVSGSAFYLGLDSFLGELPILLFTLIGGVIADRHDRRRLLMGSQYVQMATAFALMALVYFEVVQIWHIMALSFVAGTAQAFGGPAYQSLIPQLVPTDHLPNAIALNSIQFNIARVIGPLLAGVTLAAFGSAVCFGLNGLSFVAVIAGLMLLRVDPTPPRMRQRLVEELRGGLDYARGERVIVMLTVLAFVATFLGLPLLTFLPVFAQKVFNSNVGEYSRMMAYSGGGAITGALLVAWLGRFPHMGRTLLAVLVAFGLLIAAFALSRTLWLSHALLFAGGAALIIVFSMLTSLVQLIAPNAMRGRVMSIYMVAFRGGSPLGSLLSGWLATIFSAPAVLVVNGLLLSAVAVYLLTRRGGIREL